MRESVEQRMGNYRLSRKLGTGAFADVYLGTHIYLNTRVALKVLRTQVSAHSLNSFLTEARHLSRLIHPHIIRVLEFGLEAQVPYLVMDYAPGGTLRQRHPVGSVVPLPIVLSYLSALASALQYAHDQHLIHRDLKPENLLVGAKHELLLSDFGLALLASGTDTPQVQQRFGTLAYMAPEQIQGRPCPASDQYALAVLVSEWLSGRRPADGRAAGRLTLQAGVAPSAQQPGVPAGVEAVLRKALAPEPVARYVDVLSFATAFEEACSGEGPGMAPGTELAGAARAADEEVQVVVPPLPVPLTPMIGREGERASVCERLLRPAVRLLTLTGTGGVGKTRLALAVADAVAEAFAQGVCFVSLAALSDPVQVVSSLLAALGVAERPELAPFAQLVAGVGKQELLLLLDNFEQVLSAATVLSELLEACPQLKILVTSRAALHVQGEYEWAVPPLALPDLQALPALETLAQVAAVALFVERAEALKPGFGLRPDNAGLIARLCVRLGGVPLALELAAARSKVLSLEALLARLEQGVEVLTRGTQNVPARQQTWRNAIAWSYDLLSSEEQALFRCLSVFEGEFTLKAAEAVVTAAGGSGLVVLDGVAALVDKSLLLQREQEGQEPLLYMLELNRAYGVEQLAACGEGERTREAHAVYYLALAEQDEGKLHGARQLIWLRQLELEYENIRAALQCFLEHHEIEAALRLPTALRQFWFLRGRLTEGRRFLELALEACCQDGILDVSRLQAEALYVAGYLAIRQQDPEPATEYLEASLELFHHQENKGGIASSLSMLGFVQYIRGEVAQGKAKIKESLVLAQEIGDRRKCAEVWYSLGMGALYQGQYSEACKQLQEGLALFEAEDDLWGKAAVLHYLGVAYYAQGNYAHARRFSEECLELLRMMDEPYGTSEVLTVLACELAALGEMRRAGILLEEALMLARTREYTEDLVRVLCGRGYLALRQGHVAEACTYLEEGLTKMQGRWFDPRSKWGLATCLIWLGEIAFAQGYTMWAVQLCAAAETIRGANGYYSSLGKEQAYYEHTLAEARHQLGEKAFATAWAEGRAMEPQQVMAAKASFPLLDDFYPTFPSKSQPTVTPILPAGLTAREIEVLRLLARGLSNSRIAEQLVLSPYTVNSHTQSIYGKLDVNSRSAATRFAVEHHLL